MLPHLLVASFASPVSERAPSTSFGTSFLSTHRIITIAVMVEAHADVTLPVSCEVAFLAATDLDNADWLPAVRSVRHLGGPHSGMGARYEVEAGMVGKHLRGVLACTEFIAPTHALIELEDGMDLAITLGFTQVSGGCRMDVTARYAVGGGPFGVAVERASIGPARREVARAVEQFAARFGRKT